jgi:hypothetical protein
LNRQKLDHDHDTAKPEERDANVTDRIAKSREPPGQATNTSDSTMKKTVRCDSDEA